ncbi:MAG: hypothetical protein GXP26_17815 [Planctomycetes bacterium]|nr:hypothetical protein [Planctomycetota bacterium]
MSTPKAGSSEPVARQANASRSRDNPKATLPLNKSRWQLISAGVLLGAWILFLAWMAVD